MEFPMRPLHVSGIRLQTPPRGPHSRRGTRDLKPEGGSASFLRRSEAETLINTSLGKLIKGKVFAFSSPSLNLGGDRAAGDGTVNTFPVCLSLRGLLFVAGGKPSVLTRPHPANPVIGDF